MANSLTLSGLEAGYGAVRMLHGVSLTVGGGETVALLGTNGNGKSTLMKCVMGMVRPSAGSIVAEIDGQRHELVGRATEAIVDLGIGFVPEGRRLVSAAVGDREPAAGRVPPGGARGDRTNLAFCFETFPRLAERRGQLAGTMSGGEQQMLALGRALMSAPRILLIDEPSVGLAPLLVAPHDRQDQGAEGRLSAYGADGGTEFHPGDPHRRSGLRDRARPHRVRRRVGRGAEQQRADPAVLSGDVRNGFRCALPIPRQPGVDRPILSDDRRMGRAQRNPSLGSNDHCYRPRIETLANDPVAVTWADMP